MLDFDIEASVGYWIFATAHEYACAMNQELQAHGITYRQWEVLAWLWYAKELSQTELAARMGIEAPTLVGVLDRMERDGWIQRTPSETDRRKKIIRATERVDAVWQQMLQCGMRVRAKATQGISEAELKQMRQTLAKMRANFEAELPPANGPIPAGKGARLTEKVAS